jgi:hypothetical protein
MAERRSGKYLADVARIGNTSPLIWAFILPEVKDESK